MNVDTSGDQYYLINPSKGNVTQEMFPKTNVFSLYVQIFEEEKELGPQDHLIHVYHFIHNASQNQIQILLCVPIVALFPIGIHY
jgi:hypothetical protein